MNRASHGSGYAFPSDAAVSRERIDARRVHDNSGEVADEGNQSPRRKRGVLSTARAHRHGRTSRPWHPADESDQSPRRKRGVRLTARAHGHGRTSRPRHPAPSVVVPAEPSPTYARSERPGRSLLDHFVRSMLLLFLLLSPAVAEDDPPAAEDRQREQRLGQKLLKKAAKGGDEDVMDRTSRLMGEAAKRLQTDLDPGDDTQAVQRSVLEQLDRAIKQAAAQRRPKQSPSPSSKSDKRRAPPKTSTAEQRRQQGSDSATADATPSKRTTPDDARNRDVAGGELHESRRGWGNLPDRERDELIQGFDEESLERYRAWIERYYRALQEVDH